jgi:hypothetical protein
MRALLLLFVFLAACSAPDTTLKAIVGARLGSIEHSVVVVENGKIRAVGPQSSTPVPKGGEITSGLGMTLEPLPGGSPIEPGQPANLILRGSSDRVMKGGEWQK